MLLSTCSPFGIDIHDRLSLFVTTLNAVDRSTINDHFDATVVAMIPTMDATWWNTNFPSPPDADHVYGITLLDYSDPANVVATLMGPPLFNLSLGTPRNAVLVMSREGADWLIARLYLDGSAVALIQ